MLIIIVKVGNQTDITIHEATADIHILQAEGKKFFKYTDPSFSLQGYCHISRLLGKSRSYP